MLCVSNAHRSNSCGKSGPVVTFDSRADAAGASVSISNHDVLVLSKVKPWRLDIPSEEYETFSSFLTTSPVSFRYELAAKGYLFVYGVMKQVLCFGPQKRKTKTPQPPEKA